MSPPRAAALLFGGAALCAGHGAMNMPPTWLDPERKYIWAAGGNDAGCTGAPDSAGCAFSWFSNYTHIAGEPTIPALSPLLTYKDACMGGRGSSACCSAPCNDGKSCQGCDWTRKNPWRAPGSAPVFSPCGTSGGNPHGCGGCHGGGYGNGPDMRANYSHARNPNPEQWAVGHEVEVAWGVTANHGGGYQYRLCKKPASNLDLTEACFQAQPLAFVGTKQWLQKGSDMSARTEIPAVRVSTGTTPPGSVWTRLPMPPCDGTAGGGDHSADDCPTPPQFDPPIPGAFGYWFLPWNIVDKIRVPDVPPGDYVVSFRYDCEGTPQVWSQCGDVRIVAGGPTPPTPHPAPPKPAPPQPTPPKPTPPRPPVPPPSGDHCGEPACASCCTGSCSNCRACAGNKGGACASCWAAAAGAPPCNARGTQCLSDDGLSCQACWGSAPLPRRAAPAPAAAAAGPADYCAPGAACESCCTGSCSACRGYCETNKGDANCKSCWSSSSAVPPCNGRASTCLNEDKLGCESCWRAPARAV